ncbi:histidine phosphatase family protein [Ktedonobacter robiniae]|uniref:Histidine phosphatase family protein n=1 Tax=Ktedonobacter robiniae TaxID=2778365 RepID=A0ABQ3UYA5_9CHLR|nr:histidine phosphatase family protein [Ktedonobacter robiniae]GHO57527.1 hypothetical protein KSB_60020 [Ktedonobacter robiniae]
MTHRYFIRHGDYTECLRDRLANTGEIKADVLIASPMKRAKASAELLAPALGLPIVFEKDLEEWVCDDGTLTPSEFSARWN